MSIVIERGKENMASSREEEKTVSLAKLANPLLAVIFQYLLVQEGLMFSRINKNYSSFVKEKKESNAFRKRIALHRSIKNNNLKETKKWLREKIIPDNVDAVLTPNGHIPQSLMELLIGLDNIIHDFKIADTLLKKGARLPSEKKSDYSEADLKQPSFKFNYLLDSCHNMYIALRQNPDIVKERNENKQTLLHHFIQRSFVNFRVSYLLQSHPTISFNVQDHQGQTPLHVALTECFNTLDAFPSVVAWAARTHYLFNTLDVNGRAIIHLAILNQERSDFFYSTRPMRPKYLIQILLENAPGIDLNCFSATGGTAFYYALRECLFDEAHILLKAGANPFAYGSPDRDPKKLILYYEKETQNETKNAENNRSKTTMCLIMSKHFQKIKKEMDAYSRRHLFQPWIEEKKEKKEEKNSAPLLSSHGLWTVDEMKLSFAPRFEYFFRQRLKKFVPNDLEKKFISETITLAKKIELSEDDRCRQLGDRRLGVNIQGFSPILAESIGIFLEKEKGTDYRDYHSGSPATTMRMERKR